MSLNLPAQRAARSAVSLSTSRTPCTFIVHTSQRRTIFGWGGRRNQDAAPLPPDRFTEEYLKRKPKPPPTQMTGDISSTSIFEDEQLAGPKPQAEIDARGNRTVRLAPRNPDYMEAALNPRPIGRERWEVRQWISHIRRRGKLTKAEMIKRQERELLSKSHDFKTSTKKLVPLARQIAGKTLEEAILQMRFSKKKAAIDVKAHLEHAKNEAIVRRGMGLGKVEGKEFTPVDIQTKDGKRIKVDDPTRIYIDQAWVGKGLHGESPDFRARGRVHMMINPTTSLSVILKEEKTRIRLHEEKQKKIANRKVWVQLPNRPVTAQRQYYSW